MGTTTISAAGNDTLNVSVNGVSATVTLTPGVYTAATLAAEVQAKINGARAYPLLEHRLPSPKLVEFSLSLPTATVPPPLWQ